MERGTRAILLIAALALLLAVRRDCHGEEYRFDDAEIEKKAYHLGGYGEFRPVLFGLDRDAALYRLKFYNRDEGDTTAEYNGKLQLEGSLEKGIGRIFVRTNSDYRNSYQGESFITTIYDGYLSLKPSSSLTLEAGKKSLRWGKGYAWNPVAFIDRPKDPDDPELNLEGYIVASTDYIKSFAGPVQTISVTPVLFPVYDGVNDDFGKLGYINFGGRFYLLTYDTDIDFLFLMGGSRTNRYGVDFSRNITSNFEVHGEFAYVEDATKRTVDAAGIIAEEELDAKSWLLGVRYLSEAETTCIVEYYHNGAGFTESEMHGFFSFIDNGYTTYSISGDNSQLLKAAGLAEGGYGKMNPMRDYLYARISQKEPFDILYFTPALTSIINLDDGSFSLSPELLYTAITNLELRLKANVLVGETWSEYGEKQNNYRVELRVRYYF
jgi:hypothetical protein